MDDFKIIFVEGLAEQVFAMGSAPKERNKDIMGVDMMLRQVGMVPKIELGLSLFAKAGKQ